MTQRLKAVLAKIAGQEPVLGAHLAARVRTGTFCVYLPETGGALPGSR